MSINQKKSIFFIGIIERINTGEKKSFSSPPPPHQYERLKNSKFGTALRKLKTYRVLLCNTNDQFLFN